MKPMMKNSLAALVAVASIASSAVPAMARRGDDDPAGHVRQGRGADDAPGHVRRGRGADDAPGDDRGRGRGRGADDLPGAN